MYVKKTIDTGAGFSLVEIVVVGAVISVFLASASSAVQIALRVINQNSQQTRAILLAEEGLEAVRSIRDQGWSLAIAARATSTPYYLSFVGNGWVLDAVAPLPIGGVFSRAITFADVYRNNSDSDIVDIASPEGKTMDPDIRKVTATVSWVAGTGLARSISLQTYMGNIFRQ